MCVMKIRGNEVVLFQGDSITDAGRWDAGPDSLGNGYAMMTANWFTARFPEMGVGFINRGISGDRARDLKRRWEEDALSLKPDWTSIMIGINDCWRKYDSGDPMRAEDFENDCRDILSRSRKAGSRLILMEPFLLPTPPDREAWREDLDPKLEAVRRLAREFDAVLVPLDGIFREASRAKPPAFWAADGVHPSLAGHALISQSWLSAMGVEG